MKLRTTLRNSILTVFAAVGGSDVCLVLAGVFSSDNYRTVLSATVYRASVEAGVFIFTDCTAVIVAVWMVL